MSPEAFREKIPGARHAIAPTWGQAAETWFRLNLYKTLVAAPPFRYI
jgi:hypothetical protein